MRRLLFTQRHCANYTVVLPQLQLDYGAISFFVPILLIFCSLSLRCCVHSAFSHILLQKRHCDLFLVLCLMLFYSLKFALNCCYLHTAYLMGGKMDLVEDYHELS